MLDKMDSNFLAPRAPAPTHAPNRRLVGRRLELVARQNWDGETMCGVLTSIVDGDSSEAMLFPLTCGGGSTCAVNTYSNAGCCANYYDCDFATTCWDRSKWLASSAQIENDPSARVKFCTDQSVQYCLEAYYDNSMSTFVCYTDSGGIGAAATGSAALTATPTALVPISSQGIPRKGAQAQPTSPVSNPAATPAAASGSALSTGGIVAIALAGAVVILGALAFVFFYRRAMQKKAESQLQETTLMRNELAQQRMSQAPSHPHNTASWIGSQKQPDASVTEYNYSGDGSYHGSPVMNHYENEGTVAGTVDNNPAPRI